MADEKSRQQPEAPSRAKALLTIHEKFEDYERGDQITDPDEAERVLKAYPHFVTKLA